VRVYLVFDGSCEGESMEGVFSSREKAEDAIDRGLVYCGLDGGIYGFDVDGILDDKEAKE